MFEDLVKTARISAYMLENLGHQAAREFLENKTSLNSTISKLASEHSLNDECVKRVCEMANTEVDGELFRAFQKIARQHTDDDKPKLFYPKFATADADVILKGLRQTEKQASVYNLGLTDYDKAPSAELCLGYKAELQGEVVKLAEDLNILPAAQYEKALANLDCLRNEALMSKAAAELKIDAHADECYHHIKQQVLKGADLKDLYQAAVKKYTAEDEKNRVKDLFGFAARKLVDEGVKVTNDRQAIKLAYPPLSQEDAKKMITDLWELPAGANGVQVLNGSYVNDEHPLFSDLDILVKQHDEADRYDKSLVIIDDKIRYVKRKMRGESVGGA